MPLAHSWLSRGSILLLPPPKPAFLSDVSNEGQLSKCCLTLTQGFSGDALDSAANSAPPLCSQVSSFPLLRAVSFREILTPSGDVLAAAARLMPQQRETSQTLGKKKNLKPKKNRQKNPKKKRRWGLGFALASPLTRYNKASLDPRSLS